MAKPSTESTQSGLNPDDLARLTRKLMDDGNLLEAGWVGLRLAAIPRDAPAIQLREMRRAYFAGAQHLFASMMSGLDPDAEPTGADLRRMDLIAAELDRFIEEVGGPRER